MKARQRIMTLGMLVAAGCHAAHAQEPAQSMRIAVRGTATEKMAPELAAAQAAGARLLGIAPDGRAVLAIPSSEKDAAKARLEASEKEWAAACDVPESYDSVERLIVMYAAGQAPQEDELRAAGVAVVEFNEDGQFVVVETVGGVSAASINILAASENVVWVEPDYPLAIPEPPAEGAAEAEELSPTAVPNDPSYPKLWGMENIHAPAAWNTVTTSNVIVAVIDTGIDYNHPDLKANMWKNPGEAAHGKNNKDDDGNGVVDDIFGADFVNNDGDPMDDHYHGTHCAGTVGGVGNNGLGVAGVNWRVKLMGCKFLSASGGGSTSNAIKCIDYARKMGAKVMSNSWGGGGYSKALEQAIERAKTAGVLFVAAAGNSGTDNDARPHYPSSYSNDNIIAVASITSADKRSSFSCYGKKSVDIGAPGSSIYSTKPGNSYGNLSGTSMATPHVSGAAALILGHISHSGANWKSVKNMILNNARKLGDLNGKCATNGTLDIAFLEQAATTFATIEAYNDFYQRKITKTETLTSVSIKLPTTMFVHITAFTTARMTKPAGAVTVTNGLYTGSSPNAIYTRSLRRVQFDGAGDVQPISTSFGRRLGPGTHTIYWNVWPGSADLVTDSGTIMVEAFGFKGGGILEVGADDVDTAELNEDGTIKRTVVETVLESLE